MISALLVRLKPYWLHILSILSIGLNLWLITRPAPAPVEITKTEYIDRIVEKEVVKVVNNDIVKYRDRVITRTISKPGGTKIVEQIKELAGERDKSTTVGRAKVVDKETRDTKSVVVSEKAPRYLLGVGFLTSGGFSSGSIGLRVAPQLPVYLGAGVTKSGSSYGLSLNVAVIF